MDDFRKLQKLQVGDGISGGWGRKYGCPCCNRYSPRKMKAAHRRLAKVRLREQTRKIIRSQE